MADEQLISYALPKSRPEIKQFTQKVSRRLRVNLTGLVQVESLLAHCSVEPNIPLSTAKD